MKVTLLLLLSLTLTRDYGQWDNVPLAQRLWALAQKVPDHPANKDSGLSCCSNADGSEVLEATRADGRYWVTFDAGGSIVGPMPVPPERVLQHSKYGPTVWWFNEGGVIKIRCYAPGPGI